MSDFSNRFGTAIALSQPRGKPPVRTPGAFATSTVGAGVGGGSVPGPSDPGNVQVDQTVDPGNMQIDQTGVPGNVQVDTGP